jgi:hypothetical protein
MRLMVLALGMILLAGCAERPNFVGAWEQVGTESPVFYHFKADSTVVAVWPQLQLEQMEQRYVCRTGRWRMVADSTLHLDYRVDGGGAVLQEYSLDGDLLTLKSWGLSGESTRFVRIPAADLVECSRSDE